MFIAFDFKLGGTQGVDYQEVARIINSIREKYAANNVFVYSNQTITKGFQTAISAELKTIRMTYIGRDELICLVDDVFPEYWRHNDMQLIQYEKDYTEFVAQG